MEEVEYLFSKEVEKALSDSIEENELNLNLTMLQGLTGEANLNSEYVASHSSQLNSQFSFLAKSFGFEDFESMFLFAKGSSAPFSELDVVKNGQKDYANLNKVKQTVIRNGKPVEVTIYQKDEDSASNDLDKKERGSGTKEEPTTISSKDLPVEVSKPNKRVSKDVRTFLNQFYQGDTSRVGSANTETSVVRSEDGTIHGLYCVERVGDYLFLADITSDDVLTDLGVKAFFMTIKQSYMLGLGFMVEKQDSELATELFKEYGLEEQENVFVIDADTLQDVLEGL